MQCQYCHAPFIITRPVKGKPVFKLSREAHLHFAMKAEEIFLKKIPREIPPKELTAHVARLSHHLAFHQRLYIRT